MAAAVAPPAAAGAPADGAAAAASSAAAEAAADAAPPGDDEAPSPVRRLRDCSSRAAFDLEVSLLAGAVRSYRKTSLINPFPKAFVSEATGDRDYVALQRAVETLPPPSEIFPTGSTAPRISPEHQELLRFVKEVGNVSEASRDIVRPFLRGEGEACRIPQYVFEVMHNPDSARHQEFAAAAQQYGTDLAFHGSKLENWYSILKTGLMNFSGTQKQKHGSLFGEGIYLSKALSVASDFSALGESWQRSDTLGSKLRVIGVCEWVCGPDVERGSEAGSDGGPRKQKQIPSTYVVVPNPAHVRLRWLLVYTFGVPASRQAQQQEQQQRRKRWLPFEVGPLQIVLFYLFIVLAFIGLQGEEGRMLMGWWKRFYRVHIRRMF